MKIPGLVEETPLEFQIDTGAINTFIAKYTYYIILPEKKTCTGERGRKTIY